MRTFHERVEQRVVKELRQVHCDRCKRDVTVGQRPVFVEGGVVKASFGYGSRFDGLSLEADLCDACVAALSEWLCVSFNELPD